MTRKHRKNIERHDLLASLFDRLKMANVPVRMTNICNTAPSVSEPDYMPVIAIDGDWLYVKVLYWEGIPYFTAFDSFTKRRTDEEGVDQLTSLLVMKWNDRKAGKYSAGT